ncbi:uncharacterized protein BO80DRAFT_280846 [Aspergillus ibericus CBS 121593]|uniref:Uncharacterized protein n=1 Tax=Aspergillus ibericus CBS 121593 TaxID=1448316 RepID=A0A395GHY0_9EURO|nr:hypothetical protein BO80DRAFT_280846 [Aspergillus ibericus CBS 121593]RAK95035.1 hypothetical protein BO80DRAFT_280846 [Aspergillus ibericus CBS 121593]
MNGPDRQEVVSARSSQLPWYPNRESVQPEPRPGIRLLHPLRGRHLISHPCPDPFPVLVLCSNVVPGQVVCALSIPELEPVDLNSGQGRGGCSGLSVPSGWIVSLD